MAEKTVAEMLAEDEAKEEALQSGVANNFVRQRPRTPADEMGTWERAYLGTTEGLKNLGKGAVQASMETGNKLGIVSDRALMDYAASLAEERSLFEETGVPDTMAGSVGENMIAPGIAGAAAMGLTRGRTRGMRTPHGSPRSGPGGRSPGWRANAAEAGLWAGAEGLVQPVYETDEATSRRLTNMVTYGLSGAGMSSVVSSAGWMGRGLYNRFLQGRAGLGAHPQFNRATSPADVDRQALTQFKEAMDEWKVWLTPGEATKSTLLTQREAALRPSKAAVDRQMKKAQERASKLDNKVWEIMAGFMPEGEDAFRRAAADIRQDVLSTPLGDTVALDYLMRNPRIKQAFAAVRDSKTPSGFSTRAKTNLPSFNGDDVMAKRGTLGELEAVTHWIKKNKDPNFAPDPMELNQTLSELRAYGDMLTDGGYTMYRAASQRLAVRDKFQKLLDVNTGGQNSAYKGMYEAFFSSDKKFNKVMKDLDGAVDDGANPVIFNQLKTQLKQAKEILTRVESGSFQTKLLKDSDTGFSARGIGGPQGVALNILLSIKNGSTDGQLYDYITSPRWVRDYEKWSKNGEPSVMSFIKGYSSFLARTGAGAGVASNIVPSREVQMRNQRNRQGRQGQQQQ